jgi:excisionase family DNA binding protein
VRSSNDTARWATETNLKQAGPGPVKPELPEPLWRKADVCEYLAVSARTLDGWIAARKLPHVKFRRGVRFIPEDVRRFVELRRVS